MRLAGMMASAALVAACTGGDPAVVAERNFVACQNPVDFGGRAGACTAVIRDTSVPAERRAQAFFNRGMVRFQALEMTRAVMDFSRALRLDPNLAMAYYQRGLAHHENGAFDAAVADYDRALAISPNFPEAVERRTIALSGQILKDFVTRIAQADAAIEANPANATAYNNRCWERAVEGVELDRALADCNRSLELEPGNAQALDSRGLVNLKRGEYQLALIDYQVATQLGPDEAHFLYGRGVAKFQMGNATDGLADIDAALELDDTIARAYVRYGVAQPSTVVAQKP